MSGNERVNIAVLADGDVLRQERLTRSLYADLSAVEGLDVRIPPAASVTAPGAKGSGALTDASLWVFLGTAAPAAARVLIAAIQAWSARERHRVVRITAGDRSIEIPTDLADSHERVIAMFLGTGQR